ncbi:MAG: branched-chain amino acid transport system II carrier protein, partial [Pyramidobacter sp.]|nr:branched-chain amino acid transport system II carrier protein [Pyramidobacter sp.]
MRKDLSFKELLVMGGGLFSMHFGAGCLLYPVTWGEDAGSAVYAAYAGVFLSGIFLPWLGYLALANGRGNFVDLIRRATPLFGLGFVVVLILVLGPFFMLPRITAALWAGIVQLLGLRFESALPELAFNVAMYVVAFAFVSSPSKVVERVGRVLFPVLLCIVTAVIVQSAVTPLAPRVPPVFAENPTVHGFLAAYAVGDLQCALTYGLVLVHGIENAGIEKPRVSRNLLRIGVVGLGLLGLAHFGHMIA